MTFDRDLYLGRIGLAGADIAPTAGGLKQLQRAQMGAIAFENIDVLLGGVPDLDPAAVWSKTVLSARGGYCLELNQLFGLALDAFGFRAVPVLGRVRMGAAAGGPRAHHAFVVTIDGGEWLADTGFGGPGPLGPVSLSTDESQDIGGEVFRVLSDSATGEQVLERKNGEEWFALYGFDRVPVAAPDYHAANFVCARWEMSPFPNHLMMTIASRQGRVSLFNRDAKHVRDGQLDQWTISSRAELQAMFADLFRLRIDASTVASVWAKIEAASEAKAA